MTSLALPLLYPLFSAFRAVSGHIRRCLPVDMLRQTLRPAQPAPVGSVALVGAGPGSADLITLRGLERLRTADVVFYDRLADPALLAHLRPGARRVYVGKAPGCHAVPQAQINSLMVGAAQAGASVVRLKCGDPGIFGRGAEEAAACDAAGIPCEVVPGVTAACAAAAAAGSFLTERGVTERVVFATGHRRAGEITDWAACAAPGTTLACYMGVAQSAALQAGLLAAGWPASAAVEVVSKAQTPGQLIRHCRLDGLAALCASEPGLNPAILLVRWPGAKSSSAQAAETSGAQARQKAPQRA